MFFSLKKVFNAFIFNFSLFIVLMIGIQNSSTKNKVNLMISETVILPTSFIIGVSFINGSITGSILAFNIRDKNKKLL